MPRSLSPTHPPAPLAPYPCFQHCISFPPLTLVLRDLCVQQSRQPLIQNNALGNREAESGPEPCKMLGVPAELGCPIPHLESGDDPLASVLEEILIRPVRMLLGQIFGQMIVVPKPGNALSLQEGVLIPPGTPQVCKSHHDHQWGMSPLGLALPMAKMPALWMQPFVSLPFFPPQADQQPVRVKSSTRSPA